MLEANQSITVVVRTYDGKTDAETKVSTMLDHVSVYHDHSVSTGSNGAVSTDLVKIRIPYELPVGVHLSVGSTVIVDGEEKTIQRVRDNTRRRCFPHWYVEAK